MSAAGATTQAFGTVYDTSYFDSASQNLYAGLRLVSNGYTSGANGLNQDSDYVLSDGQYYPFGDGGTYEATIPSTVTTPYSFKFT